MNARNAELMRLAHAAIDAYVNVDDVEKAGGPKVQGMMILARMRLRNAMQEYDAALVEAGR